MIRFNVRPWLNRLIFKKIRVDVVIRGAGITGLMAAQKLSRHGLQVVLIDDRPKVATGASTKNEGWLHRGTYHAVSNRTQRENAVQVARRCIYGHDQIRRYAPECCQETDNPVFAITFDEQFLPEILSRWAEADVIHKAVPPKELFRHIPELKQQSLAAAFKVADISVNTPMLYRRLLQDCRLSGVLIINSARVHMQTETTIQVEGEDSRLNIEASVFVYTAGYGTKKLFEDEFGLSIPLRFWKSHLLIVHRLARAGVFCLDPHQAALMHHGPTSIVGFNEDAFQCSEPDFEIVDNSVREVREAVNRLFDVKSKMAYKAIACIKVDVSQFQNEARSLDVAIFRPLRGLNNHVVALPGKMTEAPYVTDRLTQMICEQIRDARVSPRPCDMWGYLETVEYHKSKAAEIRKIETKQIPEEELKSHINR